MKKLLIFLAFLPLLGYSQTDSVVSATITVYQENCLDLTMPADKSVCSDSTFNIVILDNGYPYDSLLMEENFTFTDATNDTTDATPNAQAITDGGDYVTVSYWNAGLLADIDSFYVEVNRCIENYLVAYYPFSGDAGDSSGNGHHGTVTNAALTTDRDGNANSAYAFDGVDDYITVPEDSLAFNFGEEYTVSLWANVSSTQVNSGPRLLSYGGYNKNGWEIVNGSNKRIITYFRNDSSQAESSKTTYYSNDDEWFHFTVTYGNDTVITYLDGLYYVSAYMPNYWPTLGYDLNIGKTSISSSEEFVGSLDEIKIYNTRMTAAEVAENSEIQQAIDIVALGAEWYATFENGLDPELRSYVEDSEYGGALYHVVNPEKDAVNGSDSVMLVSTPPVADGNFARAEYRIDDARLDTYKKKHTYIWDVYFPIDYLAVDTIWGGWFYISQFSTAPCEKYGTGEYAIFGDSICDGSGGVYNHIRINPVDKTQYVSDYRAYPDCDQISIDYLEGQWNRFVYDIYYTDDYTGYYSIWINNTLIDNAVSKRTLPGGWVDGTCDILWKMGIYSSWNDAVVDSVYYYIDNIEVYIDKNIEDVCPDCN